MHNKYPVSSISTCIRQQHFTELTPYVSNSVARVLHVARIASHASHASNGLVLNRASSYASSHTAMTSPRVSRVRAVPRQEIAHTPLCLTPSSCDTMHKSTQLCRVRSAAPNCVCVLGSWCYWCFEPRTPLAINPNDFQHTLHHALEQHSSRTAAF